MKHNKLLASILTISLLISGCVTMSPSQETWYAKYVLDPHKPPLDPEPKSPGIAALVSIRIPGMGELYLDQPAWAPVWYFLGLLLPFTAPVVAAADANTVNRILVGEQYHQYVLQKEREQESKKSNKCSFCGWVGDETKRLIFCPGCGHAR